MSLPITLTPEAYAHMLKVVQHQGALGIRLSVSKSGCSGLKYITNCFKAVQRGDQIFEDQDLTIAIEPSSLSYLQGMILDYKTIGPGQTQLLYQNPNATDTCGCGESFRLVEDQTGDDI
jgi:iron-sulfur cluster assembly protein